MHRFSEEFIEERRDMLELFLQEVVSHPLASGSERIQTFLQWPEAMRKAVAERLKNFRLPDALDADKGDPLKDAAKQVHAFEHQIQAIRERFKKLQAHQNEDGAEYQELSQNIKEMCENPMNLVLGVALNPLVEGLHTLATETKRQALHTKKTLLPKLKLHKQLAIAIQEQFKRRAEVQATVDKTNAKIKDLLSQSTKLAGKPGKEKKVSDLETQAADLQSRVSEMREMYDTFTRTLIWELERYNHNKNRDILAALQDCAIRRTEDTSKEHEIWGAMASGIVSNVNKVHCDPAPPRARAVPTPVPTPET